MTLQPLFPLWIIIPGLLFLLVGLSWLEIRRPDRWPTGRLAALTLALLAVAGLLLQPSWQKIQKEATILLLTKGFDEGVVDSLLSLHPDWQLIRTPDAEAFPKSEVLTDLLDLSALGRRIGAIAGDGLPPYALEYFTEKYFQYYPSQVNEGVSYLVAKIYHKEQVNQIEGEYFLRGAPVRLLLSGPAGVEDSVLIDQAGRQPFSLAFTPKLSGLWQYQLLVKDSLGQVTAEELLPIAVQTEKQLRVLIWQAYPTFEVRCLKDFLAGQGHAVTIRSQVSRNKYRVEFVNLASWNLNRLDAELLENFDLFIADGAAYDLLSRVELSTLATAVENGLGFLGLVTGEQPAFLRRLGLAAAASELDTVSLVNGLTLPTFPVVGVVNREWYNIHQSTDNQMVAAYYYEGIGKVGFQSTQETYALLIKGDSLAYAKFWTPVLEGIQREAHPDYTLDLLDGFPVFVGEPLDFRVIAMKPIGTVYADSLAVPMQEDYALDEVWYGRTWPGKAGWHQIRAAGEVVHYYAFPPDDWTTLATAQKRRQTAINAQPGASLAAAAQDVKVVASVSRLWFYVLFLLGAGFLWLAPKL